MSDERVWNARRSPSLQHKIRILGKRNEEITEFAVTIPKNIANEFINCKLIIHTSGNAIILESGCRNYAIEIRRSQEVNQGGTYLLVE